MAAPEIELTGAEWTIIKAVWENEPCAAPIAFCAFFNQYCTDAIRAGYITKTGINQRILTFAATCNPAFTAI
jgi:hypothetical protein